MNKYEKYNNIKFKLNLTYISINDLINNSDNVIFFYNSAYR